MPDEPIRPDTRLGEQPSAAGRPELPIPTYGAEPVPSKERVFTFYSFKGGVGRSLALFNVGAVLADLGRRVLVVDADLEAPGLTVGVFPGADEQPADGFLELLAEAVDSLRAAEAARGAARPLTDDLHEMARDYLREVPLEGLRTSDRAELRRRLREAVPDRIELPEGRLDMIGAGNVFDHFAEAIGGLRLGDLFGEAPTDAQRDLVRACSLDEAAEAAASAGHLLVAVLRRTLHMLRKEYDYILIDSRTGLADVAGLCTQGLPDRLVILFGLNEQNIRGTKHMLDLLRAGGQGMDRVILVASPVPHAEAELAQDRLRAAAVQFGVSEEKIGRIHYYPRLALAEMDFLSTHRMAQAAEDYRRLARRVRDAAGAELGGLLSEVREAGGGPLSPESMGQAGGILLEDRQEGTRALDQLASVLGSAGAARPAADLRALLAAAWPDDAERQGQLGVMLASLAAAAAHVAEADNLFVLAERALKRARDLETQRERAEAALGTVYHRWARSAQRAADPTRARELFAESFSKYELALSIKEDSHEAATNWGNALLDAARLERDAGEGARARELFAESFSKYELALCIKEDSHEAANNWGSALLSFAQLLRQAGEPQEMERVLGQAQEVLDRAETLKPGSATYNLACLDSIRGDTDAALAKLGQCLAGDGRLQRHAREDEDLRPLWDDPRFQALTGERETDRREPEARD
jgi:MinD-like ATPase involved in chromosome partitioning or flagellar assembly